MAFVGSLQSKIVDSVIISANLYALLMLRVESGTILLQVLLTVFLRFGPIVRRFQEKSKIMETTRLYYIIWELSQ